MISIFRKNLFINSIFLLPYILILRLKFLLEPEAILTLPSQGYLSGIIQKTITSPVSLVLLVAFIIFINALLINRITIKNHLYKENTLIPGMLYALFTSLLIVFIPFSDVHFASFFILLSLQSMFNSYNNVKSADDIMLAGFYLGMASLFYFPCIVLLLFGYFGFNIMRSFNAKEVMQYLLGWTSPFYLVLIYQYFSNDYNFVIPYYFVEKVGISQFLQGFNITELLITIVAIILSFFFLVNYGNYMGKKVMVAQKRISILFFFLLFIFIMVFFYKYISLTHLLLLCIPSSIFVTFNILDMKNRIWPEIIHLLIVLILVINHLELIKLN